MLFYIVFFLLKVENSLIFLFTLTLAVFFIIMLWGGEWEDERMRVGVDVCRK